MAADKKLSIEIAAIDAFSKTFTTVQSELQDLQRQASKQFGATPSAIQGELTHLQGQFNKSTENMTKASTAATGAMSGSIAKTTESVGGLNSALGTMAQYVVGAFSVSAIVGFIKSTFDASMAMDSINSKLQVVAGSSQATAQEWEFVSQMAKRLGLDIQTTADTYASFMIAAKGTSAEGDPARKFFLGLSEAITAMHLPAERATGILTQFQQMLAKGRVNQQDMKVAAESGVPVYRLLADSMGITTRRLMEMMEQGQVLTADVLPALAKGLHETFGASAEIAATKGRAALNNFKTALFELKLALGDATKEKTGGTLPFLTGVIEKLKETIPLIQQSKIWWGSLIDKLEVWNNAGGLIGLMKGGPRARAELKAEFAAIDQLTNHAWDKTLAIGKQAAQKQAGEDTRNSQRRRDEAKKTGEDLAKINLAYAKAINQSEDELTATMAKEYQERIGAVKAYYDQKKAASKSNDEEVVWEKFKTIALKNLATQQARDNEIITAQMIQRGVDLRKEGLAVEINAIKQQAANRVITEEQAEQQITLLTVAALRDQYTARQYVAEKIAAIYGKDSDDYKKALKEQQSSHKAYIDANMAAYKTYADKIKNLDKEIADFRRSISEKIADLKQKGMTDEQKYADNLARFNTAIDAAESARRQKKTEDSLRYSKQAEELAIRLGDTQTEKINGAKAAEEALRKVEENRVKILEGQKAEAQENLDKLKALNEQKLDPKKLEINLDEAALARVNEEIGRLTKTETKKIFIETIGPSSDSRYTNYQGMATGGRVGGSGIGDNQLRLLDPREHVIRPEATAYWGDGLLSAFNAPWSAFGQAVSARLKDSPMPYIPTVSPSFAMANGGPVGFGVGVADMGSVTLNFGGGSYPVMGKVDVINELKTALRREALTRPQ